MLAEIAGWSDEWHEHDFGFNGSIITHFVLVSCSNAFITAVFFFSDEGVYNTFVLDSDYTSWALLLHCAEKSKVPRYLSSFIMSREPVLGINVISYLRDKLPRYDIDLSYMFQMTQNDCNSTALGSDLPPSLIANRLPPSLRRHPMKHHHGEWCRQPKLQYLSCGICKDKLKRNIHCVFLRQLLVLLVRYERRPSHRCRYAFILCLFKWEIAMK